MTHTTQDEQDYIISKMLLHSFIRCVIAITLTLLISITVFSATYVYTSISTANKYNELIQAIIDAGIDVTQTTVFTQTSNSSSIANNNIENVTIGR